MMVLDHSTIITNEDEKKIGNFYIIRKDYYLTSVSRDTMLFIARLKEKKESKYPTYDGSRIVQYYFTDYVVFYYNNERIIPMSQNIPIDAPYTSYFPETQLLFSCIFHTINLKPLSKVIMKSIELYSYEQVKDDIMKKTRLPMDIIEYTIPHFISFFPEKT
jgi:hypothetical protein